MLSGGPSDGDCLCVARVSFLVHVYSYLIHAVALASFVIFLFLLIMILILSLRLYVYCGGVDVVWSWCRPTSFCGMGCLWSCIFVQVQGQVNLFTIILTHIYSTCVTNPGGSKD